MKKLSTILLILSMFFLLSACSDDNDDPASTTTGTGTDTGKTTTTTSYPGISGHGILWKPVSDSNRKLAVLLNRSYGRPTVKVLDMNKNVIETGYFVYYSNPNRATYRFGRPGRSFPSPCLIQVGSAIYKVDNPAKRYE